MSLAESRPPSTGREMPRRRFLLGAGGVGLAAVGAGLLASSGACAPWRQDAHRRRSIGYLTIPFPQEVGFRNAFLQGLHERGWIDGTNLRVVYRFSVESGENLDELALELVQEGVEVIVAAALASTQAAQRATSTIPVVMLAAHDPVKNGLVASLAWPGGNITGLTANILDLTGKQLELLHEAAKPAQWIGVLWNPGTPPHQSMLEEAARAAHTLGLETNIFALTSSQEVQSQLHPIVERKMEALLVLGGPVNNFHLPAIIAFATQQRLPAIYTGRRAVELGGLMGYGASMVHVWTSGAGFVDKILRGVNPSQLPVEQPTRYEFVINTRSAETIGLRLPRQLLYQATEVIATG